MSVVEGYGFKNSDSCEGYGALFSDGEFSQDIIRIEGSYPEEGQWARNNGSVESVVIASGRGGVALRGAGYHELDASAEPGEGKHAVDIPIRQWFRWDGDMTISMVCHPAFDPELYEVKSEEDITQSEKEQ